MTIQVAPQTGKTVYRNFNLCPHCNTQGKDSLLSRLAEGIPMISRSDGHSFHLLLADEPQPYPSESGSAEMNLVSVCFWYSHATNPAATRTSIVLIPEKQHGDAAFFRRIEDVADLLAEKLSKSNSLATLYRLEGTILEETSF